MLRHLSKRLASKASLNNSTSLITLYIPPTTKIVDLNKLIQSEISKAPNIKSRQTRQGVQDALQSVLSHIKQMNSIPPNGMAIFTGHCMDGFENVTIEPPQTIDRFFYRCDNVFHL